MTAAPPAAGRVTLSPKALLSLLAMPLSVARPSSPVQTLQCVHIKDRMVTATTLDTSIEVNLQHHDALAGIEGCVEAKRLALALGTLDQNAPVTMKQQDAMLTLRCAGSTRKLKMLPASDFPLPVWGEGEETQIADPALLTYAIRSVRHAVATSTLRPMFCGLSAKAGALFCSDGFRAARVQDAAERCGIHDGIILPSDVLDHLLVLAEEASKESAPPLHALSVGSQDGHLRAYMVRHGIWRMQFQLVGAEPPPIDRVMTAPSPQVTFSVQREPLREAARNITRMSPGGKTPPMAMLTLTPGDGDGIASLRIEMVTKDVNSSEEVSDRMGCSWTGTQEWSCGINPSFVADALDALEGNEVIVRQADSGRRTPLLFSGNDERLVCLVQPMTI